MKTNVFDSLFISESTYLTVCKGVPVCWIVCKIGESVCLPDWRISVYDSSVHRERERERERENKANY